MKIQPIDFHSPPGEAPASAWLEPAAKPAAKSRLKRLFERQFTSVIRTSAAPEKPAAGADYSSGGEFEPSSACLVKMVHNFIECGGERPQPSSSSSSAASRWCGRNASFDDSELSFCDAKKAQNSLEGCEILKGLAVCASVTERNLLADTARIVDRNSKACKRKDEICRKIVTNGLLALGYDASVCKSRWEKSASCNLGGEYEYIDVIIEGERYFIDVDFRSEFEIARPTKAYKTIVQVLPHIYVGRSDRLQRIVSVVSDAAKQSLRKKGMLVPPWRRREYVASKWLAPHARVDGLPARRDGAEPAGRVDEWVSLPPRQHVGFGVRKKKITAGLASVMMDD